MNENASSLDYLRAEKELHQDWLQYEINRGKSYRTNKYLRFYKVNKDVIKTSKEQIRARELQLIKWKLIKNKIK